MRKPIRYLACLASGCLMTTLVVIACDDEPTPVTPAGDGGTSGVDASGTDSGGGQDSGTPAVDSGNTADAAPKAGVLHAVIELVPQDLPGAPSFVVGTHLISYPDAERTGTWGVKPNKVSIPGQVPGLGCFTVVYNASNPPPAGANEGDLTLTGFTGGATQLPDGGIVPVVPPSVCTRQTPDGGAPKYACPFEGLPVNEFIDKADTLRLVAAGGSDVGPFDLSTKPPPVGKINVTNNLFALPANATDGTADLVLNYDCDGASCATATLLGVLVDTTDTAPDPTNPFDFPPPTVEGGRAICIGFAAASASSFTMAKSLLDALPKTYAAVRTAVIVGNANQSTTDAGTPISLVTGVGRFGVTVR